jgi:hypothetical protein
MVRSLKMFGNLGNLMALYTLSLHFYGRLCFDDETTETWSELDEVLAQARDTLKDVQIFTHKDEQQPDLNLLRGLLPSVAGKISVYSSQDI